MKGKGKGIKRHPAPDITGTHAALLRESGRLKSGTHSSAEAGGKHSLAWDRQLRGSRAAFQPWRERLECHRSGS